MQNSRNPMQTIEIRRKPSELFAKTPIIICDVATIINETSEFTCVTNGIKFIGKTLDIIYVTIKFTGDTNKTAEN